MTKKLDSYDKALRLTAWLYEAGFDDKDILDIVLQCPGVDKRLNDFIKDYQSTEESTSDIKD